MSGADAGFFKGGGGAKLPDIIIWVMICNTVDREIFAVVSFLSVPLSDEI